MLIMVHTRALAHIHTRAHKRTRVLQVYHGTVGRNGFLMLDFAPDRDGLIAPDQAQRYKQFGRCVPHGNGRCSSSQKHGAMF